jgi:hypothetical protein
MMTKMKQMEVRIAEIKAELMALGDMRPGSISRQQRARGGLYLHLSYTYQGKGKTEYVPPELEEKVNEQLANYKRFKVLTQEWIGLAMELARIKLAQEAKEE